jgi:hypothetical protein
MISYSEARQFRQCQRKWYFKYALASWNSRDPRRREAFVLSKLQDIATQASRATTAIGCQAASNNEPQPIGHILNSAWDQFWADPIGYGEWQRNAVQRLVPLAA